VKKEIRIEQDKGTLILESRKNKGNFKCKWCKDRGICCVCNGIGMLKRDINPIPTAIIMRNPRYNFEICHFCKGTGKCICQKAESPKSSPLPLIDCENVREEMKKELRKYI